MIEPRITLNGMYLYDPTLFDGIVLPTGMDRELMVRQIIRQSGDLFPLYQNPEVVKQTTTDWFARRLVNFTKLYEGYTADYNPVENYDRYEDSTETPDITRAHDNTLETSGTDTDIIDRTVTNGGSDSSTSTGAVQGFNSTEYKPNSQTVASGSSSTNSKEDAANTTTRSGNNKDSGTETETGTRKYESRIHGNIGVTTAAQMLEGETRLRRSFDLYVLIAEEYETDNLLQIY